jgi:hypothetical protein
MGFRNQKEHEMKFTSLKHFEFVPVSKDVWECGDIKVHKQDGEFVASRDNMLQYVPGVGLTVLRIWLTDANGDTMRLKTPQEAAEEALKQWI